MVQCEECEMWRLLYSKRKLQLADQQALERSLENVAYTCGAQLQDMEDVGTLAEVYARNIRCNDPIEKLYYSVGTYPPVCIYCACESRLVRKDGCYPQCEDCTISGKESIKKSIKKRNLKCPCMYLCVMSILLCHHSFLGYLECSMYISLMTS